MLDRIAFNKKLILQKSLDFFSNSSSLIPKIGIELEFFLFHNCGVEPVSRTLRDEFISDLKGRLLQDFHFFYEVEKEQGISQIEIKSSFTSDLSGLAAEIDEVKKITQTIAKEKNLIASFASKPLENDCGSALQFNISLHNFDGKNLFTEDEFLLNNAIVGLLQNTNQMMIFLADKEEDYSRFSYEANRELFRRGKFTAPVNLSFGNDNRTCAIRIPPIFENHGKRLEYRVAAAGASPHLSMSVLLLALSDGLSGGVNADKLGYDRIYGNAFDDRYCLKNLCKNLEEAKKSFFQEDGFIQKKIGELIV